MVRTILLLFFILIIANDAKRINYINNAAYISSNLTNVFLYSGTCYECMCYAFFSNISINYEAFNCYKNNNTCLLFTNYLSKSMIRINVNSTFLFKESDLLQTTNEIPTSTIMKSTTTSSFQCYLPEWNSTGITFASSGTNLNQIYHPYGLFIAADSDILYIADTDNNRILKWLPNATSGILVAGGQGVGSNATQLKKPIEVCVDKNDNVYVADTGNYRIQYFDNGSLIGRTIAGNGTLGSTNNLFGQIFGLGIDLANNVYVSDYNNARVTKWSPNATYGVLVAGTGVQGNAQNQLNIPTAFYVDPVTGTLYIPNQGSHCITKWLPGSSIGTVVAGVCGVSGSNETLLNNPKCVTFDKYKNMYTIDSVNGGRIIMFCPNSLIGIPIVTSGLNNPISIAVDTHLNLYVADWGSNRIIKYMLL